MDTETVTTETVTTEEHAPETTAEVEAAAAAASAEIAAEAAAGVVAMANVAAAQVVAEAAAEIAEVHADVEQQEDRITACLTAVSELRGLTEGLATQVATLAEQISSIQTKFASLPAAEQVIAAEAAETIPVQEPESVAVVHEVVRRKRRLL